MDTTIGMRIPKVPQLVPVAKAKNIATTNITTGRKELRPLAAFSLGPFLCMYLLYRDIALSWKIFIFRI